jgi:hypothetical protein
LLNCTSCHDIISLAELATATTRSCHCGKSSGKYVDDLWVHYSGPARILGLLNSEYTRSLKEPTRISALGLSEPTFKWFVIVEGEHIKKVKHL